MQGVAYYINPPLRRKGEKKGRGVGLLPLPIILRDDINLKYLLQATALSLAFEDVVDGADYIVEVDSAVTVVVGDRHR